MEFQQLISEGLLKPFKGGRIGDAEVGGVPLLVRASGSVAIDVAAPGGVQIVVLHDTDKPSSIVLTLAEGCSASVADIYTTECYASTSVVQEQSSSCRLVSVMLAGAHAEYTTQLNGAHAESDISGVFVATGHERCSVAVDTRHNVADCRSSSLVKGVAAGRATGEFRGMVYVAKDAQRTDAAQLNRNVELGSAHIVSMPQLEIYADDVKCSHGTTIGRLDEEAVYYMQQRGIGRREAERLQIEGFVCDVVSRCEVEPLVEQLAQSLNDKLQNI